VSFILSKAQKLHRSARHDALVLVRCGKLRSVLDSGGSEASMVRLNTFIFNNRFGPKEVLKLARELLGDTPALLR
jgi:hypothetical protein